MTDAPQPTQPSPAIPRAFVCLAAGCTANLDPTGDSRGETEANLAPSSPESDDAAMAGASPTKPSAADRAYLELAFDGLEPLGGGFRYEGWLIASGEPISTGKFDVPLVDGSFAVDGSVAAAATKVVITIEPADDPDPGPAKTHILAGTFSGGGAELSIATPSALGSDFGSAAGSFLLATPTDGPMSNECSGVWFLDPHGGMPQAALSLPVLPPGWTYEGWAIVEDRPLTTGKFVSPDGADAAAPFSGPEPGPPFPGEDFLENAPPGVTFPADLRGGAIAVTIEPYPDDDPGPFALKVLAADVPSGARSMQSLPLAKAPVTVRGSARLVAAQ
jgi:hypothetical protein